MAHGAASYSSGHKLEVVLGPDRTAEIKGLLTGGAQVKDLVKMVQDKWGLFKDKQPSTVTTMLYRYSRDVVKRETVERVMATVETRGHIKVDTLVELGQLCSIQRGRLEKALKIENKVDGLITKMVSDELRLLKDMVRDLAYLQMETGILPRAPKTVKGMLIDENGRPTAFGWIEQDEVLLERLTSQEAIRDVDDDEPSE